eukprot:6183205-Pleurochrysis_carterae.AAC.1
MHLCPSARWRISIDVLLIVSIALWLVVAFLGARRCSVPSTPNTVSPRCERLFLPLAVAHRPSRHALLLAHDHTLSTYSIMENVCPKLPRACANLNMCRVEQGKIVTGWDFDQGFVQAASRRPCVPPPPLTRARPLSRQGSPASSRASSHAWGSTSGRRSSW